MRSSHSPGGYKIATHINIVFFLILAADVVVAQSSTPSPAASAVPPVKPAAGASAANTSATVSHGNSPPHSSSRAPASELPVNSGPTGAPPPAAAPAVEGGSATKVDELGIQDTGDAKIRALFSTLLAPFEYDPNGRKDPFVPPGIEKPLEEGVVHGPVLPLQKYNLEELGLQGIIWDVARPRALIKDPTGQLHVVGPHAKIGNKNGYIAVIREGEVVIIETSELDGKKLLSAPRIVKLPVSNRANAGSQTARQ